MEKLMNFLKDEEGAGMVEYALLIGLIGIFLITAITLMRGSIANLFELVGEELDGAPGE